jgi:hypothetical protein
MGKLEQPDRIVGKDGKSRPTIVADLQVCPKDERTGCGNLPLPKAMLAAAALPFYEAEAKERQKRKPATDPDSVSATLHGQIGKATEKAAAATGASGRSVARAVRLLGRCPSRSNPNPAKPKFLADGIHFGRC